MDDSSVVQVDGKQLPTLLCADLIRKLGAYLRQVETYLKYILIEIEKLCECSLLWTIVFFSVSHLDIQYCTYSKYYNFYFYFY